MDKSIQLQQKVRQNADNFQSYMSDLKQWEIDMKRKESELNNVPLEQEIPPVRSKVRKSKVTSKTIPADTRIASSDYKAWDKFDADKACEMVDEEDVGPISLDSKISQKAKEDKLKEEAIYEKEQGNKLVKLAKWDEAIKSYSRAIDLDKKDPVFHANRALCHLKKDNLHAAIADCTQAVHLDPTYVKAYLRRSLAREKLGSLRGASEDLQEVLKLEPDNESVKKQLGVLKKRMGSKGSKSKSSPATTPTIDPPFKTFSTEVPKIVELTEEENNNEPNKNSNKQNQISNQTKPDREELVMQNHEKPKNEDVKEKLEVKADTWKDGSDDGVTIVSPIKKPPHLRSKKPLKRIEIVELPIGATVPNDEEFNVKPPTRLKIEEVDEIPEEILKGDSSIIESNKGEETRKCVDEKSSLCNGDVATVNRVDTPTESQKLKEEICSQEKKSAPSILHKNMFEIPTSSVQFTTQWKSMKGKLDKRSAFLSAIDAKSIPNIFRNSLESDLLSEILKTIRNGYDFVGSKEAQVLPYLLALSEVPRFSAMAMFLSQDDKKVVSQLLEHCKTSEGVDNNAINYLKSKYEV